MFEGGFLGCRDRPVKWLFWYTQEKEGALGEVVLGDEAFKRVEPKRATSRMKPMPSETKRVPPRVRKDRNGVRMLIQFLIGI